LNAVHFDSSDEEAAYLDYIVERSQRERELLRDAAAVQQQERERVIKEIAEGRVPTASAMENQINYMRYRRRVGGNITFQEWQELKQGAEESKPDDTEDPPVDPPEVPPVVPTPPAVDQKEGSNTDQEPKRVRFGFFEIDGDYEFVDEDLVLSTLEFDKKIREAEDCVNVDDLFSSDSEECEKEYDNQVVLHGEDAEIAVEEQET